MADITGLRAAALNVVDLTQSGTAHGPRTKPPAGIICHTPGRPFMVRALDTAAKALGRSPSQSELDGTAARRFDSAKYLPGYAIGQSGTLYVLESDNRRTMHSGTLGHDCPTGESVYRGSAWGKWASPSDGSGWQLHGRDPAQVYDYWYAAFPGAVTPLDVFPWHGSPNDCIGVDLFPEPVTGAHTAAQRATFAILIRFLSGVHGFPVDDRHVTTHTLASPVERGTQKTRSGQIIGVHWDPDARAWDLPSILETFK